MSQLYNNQQTFNPTTTAANVILAGGSDLQTYINNGGGGGGGSTPSIAYSRYAAIGDSITYADNYYSYANGIATMLGVPTFDKLAQSGRTIYQSRDNDFLSQCDKVVSGTDLITIMMGTNDAPHIANNTTIFPLGTVAEIVALSYTHNSAKTASNAYTDAVADNSTWDSILGKFRFGLEFLKNKFPSARIVVITPIQTTSGNSTEAERNSLRDGEWVMAQLSGAECLYITKDLFFGTYFIPYLSTASPAGVHPTSLGQQILAKRIYQYIVYGT